MLSRALLIQFAAEFRLPSMPGAAARFEAFAAAFAAPDVHVFVEPPCSRPSLRHFHAARLYYFDIFLRC